MEAVGHLTGGVAHDFNNLLQVILANLQIAREQNKDNTTLLGWLEAARRAGWRGAELTQKLLSFSRKQTLYPEAVDPEALIAGMLDLLHRTLGEDVEIRTTVDADVPAILIDPGGLENAILNLVVNARAAMRGGGTLTIECRPKKLETETAIDNDTLPAGGYVEIAIADSGCGMPPEILERAFEPFFTTKDVGEGSGLGLSMVYGFARQSGGNVSIASEVGVGTTITLLLPSTESAESHNDKEAEATDSHDGSGAVLVVEDDPDVRASTVDLFEMLGYETFEAEDGGAALEVLEQNAGIGLLFSDVVMPNGMSGFDLAREAMRQFSDLKVVLCSGYPETDLRKSGLPEGEFQLLTKPYTLEELSAVLNAIIDRL
jgi:CheY-like chemotaxis protein